MAVSYSLQLNVNNLNVFFTLGYKTTLLTY